MTEEKRPLRKAAALTYDAAKSHAPVITASGTGRTADQIIARAKEHNVPIQEDETLIQLLSELNINETIPVDLYEAVAEVFAFIYQVDKQAAK